MRVTGYLFGLAVMCAPCVAAAKSPIDLENSVFEGDYVIVMAGLGYSPSHEGSDDYRVLPLAGVTGEVSGVNFTIRGPSLTVRLIETKVAPDVKVHLSPQLRYRGNRTGSIGDDVVAKLGKLDGVVEAGFRLGVNFDDLLSTADGLSVGVSTRWDVSGKGSGMVVTPSMTYRLPVSQAHAFGFLLSGQFVDGDYADYNYTISPAGSLASGLPTFDAKGGFKRITAGLGTARDLSGNALDGGFSVGVGVLYTRLIGSAAKTPITSIRGDRNQWLAAGGLAFIF